MTILVFVFDLILRTMIKVEIAGKENLRKNLVTQSRPAKVEIERCDLKLLTDLVRV